MKGLLLTLSFLITGFIHGQILDPVDWNTRVEKISETEYDLVIEAEIDKGWHLYAQDVPENGPIPTSFTFEPTDNYELIGDVTEDEGKTINDPVFEMMIKFFEDHAEFRQRIKLLSDGALIEGEVEFMVCDDARCLPPSYVDLSFRAGDVTEVSEEITPDETDTTDSEKITDFDEGEIAGSTRRSLWGIFFIAFLSGFAALLTPCVFPMIPLTVSFFTKQSKNKAAGIRNALFYGIAIILIYVLLGSLVTAIFGADALNALSTNVTFNILFFLLLVIFAVSFLGAFEITLPNSWASTVDKQSTRGGIIGILFMALALAIVSFSCTGPIVGTLLVEAASKGGLAPIVGMFGFSLALALPFALFAAFPGWMNSLPKSGGWLNTVKVTLGFLELALAFKFLSNADLVLQLHWLEREVFLAIWIAIFGALALYLFGKIRLPHDSPAEYISVGRLSVGLLVLSFVIYLIPGLWGAPLKMISGFPPPLNYSEAPYGVGYTRTGGSGLEGTESIPEGAHLGPHDIVAFTEYEKGLAYAREVNKPILIDFTGHACVNCRKMEDKVWSDPKVLDVLKNEVVLISLYVDDKRDLPDTPENISEITGEKFRNIGQKWSEFQQLRYKANAQPFYVLIDENENKLIEPSAYNPDVEAYYDWLQKGIKNY
ncbi:protein-disulfide reductase DsbD family protein [Robertkochia aurantiaca]|uniref:protein-disulfide reductase DsbD family protein n=1 Tax=Robertkochia aurantiaca TaxID=2873700 RepID=UPI001CCB3644|nr:thioredoxin family protein [Robertkochia sp. 3YJGBD-33]